MKALSFALFLLIAFPLVSLADTTSELELISGTSTVTILDNGSGDLNPANGDIIYSNSNFNGWSISFVNGATNSPNLSPAGLDLASLTATCAGGGGCTTQPLEVLYSDINFNAPVGANGFQTVFSTTQTGNGTATESAWFSNLNTLFSELELIGTVGPFSGSNNSGQATGGPVGAVPPYSLTLEQLFTDPNGSIVSFSADGNIVALTPEPSSLALILMGVLMLSVVGIVRVYGPTNSRPSF
jgi:hypothetical protein